MALALIGLLLVAVHIVTATADPDLWWHIVVGRWVLAHAAVPRVDYWTMFASGQPWRAYSWLFDIVVALVDRYLGLRGLVMSAVGLLLAIGVLAALLFRSLSKNGFLALLLAAVLQASLVQHFSLRPQALVWGLFLMLLLVLSKFEPNQPARLKYALLFLLGVFWSNIHLSAVFGLVTVLFWLVGRRPWRVLGQAALLFLLGTIMTPYLGFEWLTMLETATHPLSMRAIDEFRMAALFDYSICFFIMIAVALALQFRRIEFKRDGGKFVLLVGFLSSGLYVVKFMPFALMVGLALLADTFSKNRAEVDGNGLERGVLRLEDCVNRIPAPGLIFLLGSFAIVGLFNLLRSPINMRLTPVVAMDYVQELGLPQPLLNTFGQGGYVAYRLAGQDGELANKVAIDGRTNLISAALWEAFQSAFFGKGDTDKLLLMVKPQTILWRNESPFTEQLIASKNWCLIQRFTEPQLRPAIEAADRPLRGDVLFVSKEWLNNFRAGANQIDYGMRRELLKLACD